MMFKRRAIVLVLVALPMTTDAVPLNTCEQKEADAACWMELERRPGCYVWRETQQEGEFANWSGSCANGKVEGKGVLTWKKGLNSSSFMAFSRGTKPPFIGIVFFRPPSGGICL